MPLPVIKSCEQIAVAAHCSMTKFSILPSIVTSAKTRIMTVTPSEGLLKTKAAMITALYMP